MAEQYSDFIWDYYGGRPFRRTCPGGMMRSASWMKAAALDGNRQPGAVGVWPEGQDTGKDMEYFQAMYPEKKVTVLANGCAGLTPEKHKAALETMKSCQVNVVE